MKRTPFYHQFCAAGATMAPAQGWLMPDEVTGNRAEHEAVRTAAGLFDWSSTGEIEVAGPHALALVQKVIVNDAASLPVGRVLYTTMCRPDGAIFSDITVYRLAEQRFWLMTAWGSNAAGARPEYDWLIEHGRGLNACVTDLSPGVALLAVQGPAARTITGQLTPADLTRLRTMDFVEAPLAAAPRALISRTGYTGELGYELCFPPEYAADVWDALLAAGGAHGLQPAGLKTAFSLRMEKGYIMRFDFMDGVTPFEAGLGWTVKLDKGDFIGRDALARQQAAGIGRKLVSVAMGDPPGRLRTETLPPNGAPVWHAGEAIGKVTSSAYGHTVGRPLALALLPVELAQEGLAVEVEVAGARHPAQIVRRPYYDPGGARLKS
jgi:aminomethyltransferase